MGPESERRFAEVVVARGLASPEAIREALARRQAATRAGGAARALPQLLCDLGLLERDAAAALLSEVRRARRAGGTRRDPELGRRGSSELVSPPAREGGHGPGGTERLAGPGRPPAAERGAAWPGFAAGAPPVTAGAQPGWPGAAGSAGPSQPGHAGAGVGAPARRASARLGPYALEAELGRGGMGVVYRAQDTRLRREVALKVVPLEGGPAAAEPFLREARAAARLRHPGIVVVYGAEVIDGRAVVALELVEGGSLAERLAGGPLGPREAARIVAELAEAVEAAHREGVIHRDLKPANVLLDPAGRPRLTDFGLARDQRASIQVTASGDVLGTPAYMAPEQALGHVHEVGPATDVYGLGAVLYEALTGGPPFTGRTVVEVCRKVAEDPPVTPSAARAARGLEPVARDLETVCLKALEKAPGHRYASAAAFGADLQRWLDGRPVEARPPGRLERLVRAARRARAPVAVAAAVALTAGFGGGAAALHRAWSGRALVARVLEQAARGELRERPAAREEAVLALLQARTPATATRLAAPLEVLAADLLAVRCEALLEAATPRDEAERAEQGRLADLPAAVDALRAAGPGERLAAPHRAALRAARGRLQERLRRDGSPHAGAHRGVEAWIARRQRDRVGDGRLAAAGFACEALGRLGLEEGVEALGRYALAEDDDERAAVAGEALARLDLPRARGLLLRACDHFGEASRFARRALAELRARSVKLDFEATTAEALRDRADLKALFDDQPGALEDLDRAHALGPDDPLTLATRAGVLLDLDRWEDAVRDLDRLVALEPEEAQGWRLRARARSRLGDLEGALADCARALELDPHDARTWLARAGVRHRRRDDLQGAAADATRALELAPSLPDALVVRARVRQAQGDLAGAHDDLNRAVALDGTEAGLFLARGALLEELGRHDDALADFDRALALDARDAGAWTRRARLKRLRKDAVEAIADATRAIELDPRRGDAWSIRAAARAELGQLAEAAEDHERAVALDPRSAVPWAERGIFRAKQGALDDALADLDRALALDPVERGALSWRAYIRLQRGDARGAVEDVDRLLGLGAEEGQFRTLRGMAHQQLGDVNAALADYGRAIELMPAWADVRGRRALLLVELGLHQPAWRDADEGLRVEPGNARCLEARGLAAAFQARWSEAAQDLARALEALGGDGRAPDGPDAARVRRALVEVEARRRQEAGAR